MKVIIVGAGYGGLSAAIACRKQGYDVLVFEQAPQFMRVLPKLRNVLNLKLGDSIGFGPNASRLLCRWGLGDDMAAISCKAKEMVLKHWDTGEVILSQPTGINDEAAPSMIGHRGYFKGWGTY